MICPSCNSENDSAAEACFQCGISLYALTRGAVLADRYEVRRLLGKGGMGVVYECHDRSLDELVALKVLRATLAANPEVARRFRSEIKLARRVRHRNVCGIHEYGEAGPISFIVMELVDGNDLRQVLREHGAFPADTAFEIAAQAADGLQAIHEAGIIHRDLKTPNLMRSADGTVRLMDFGIAKQFGVEGTAATATGQVLGTPEYMSPEQGRGEKIDQRTDIYSMGIVIFELFTGRVPFQGDTPFAIIFKHLEEPPPLEDPQLPLPPSLVPVLRRALAKQPNGRQNSAAELATELRGAARQAAATSASLPDSPATTPLPPLPRTPPTPHVQPDASRTHTIHKAQPDRHAIAPAAPERSAAPVEPARVLPSAPSGRAVKVVVALALGLVLTMAFGIFMAIRTWNDRTAGSARPNPADEPEQTVRATLPVASLLAPTATPTVSPPVADPSPMPTPRADRTHQAPAVSEPTRQPTPAPSFGVLEVRVRPWAEVILDGESLGTTPLRPVRLSIGDHEVELLHPKYKPLRKRVTVAADATFILEVDLPFEAFPK